MKSEPQWLSTDFDPVMFQGVETKVIDRAGREIIAKLEIESIHSNGRLVISANYDSSKFYLTQEELGELQSRGGMCVFKVPMKD